MLPFRVQFDHPWWLAALLLAPLLYWWSRRSLAALGPVRRWLALALRLAVFAALVLALAELRLLRTSERMTVVFLLDQSLSIPPQQRQAMIEYTNAAIREFRRPQDQVGVIVFGREAALEIPPFDDDVQVPSQIESRVDQEHTNLAAALRLAQASFPEGAARRIVIISDGNQNLGDVLEQARTLVDAGVGVDVQPVYYQARSDISVEKLALPADVRQGQPFDMRVVVENNTPVTESSDGRVSGTLRVSQIVSGQPQTISEQPVTLAPGKQVFTLRQQLDQPNFYTFEAQFIPDDPAADALSQNNRATNFTSIRGTGQVLLIENHEQPAQFDLMVEQLRAHDLDVTVRNTDQLFTSLAELQPFDTVLLANVPRESFSDDQIQMLVSNTEQMGAGLVMLGGPESFGAGGWTNTPLEEAMPLDFQIKNAKVIPKGALALVMHASELAKGNYWQKVVARDSIRSLGDQDYCGLLQWQGTDRWLWNHPQGMVVVGPNRRKMLALLDRMTPGDMPAFDPSLVMAKRAFDGLKDAAIKHMIVISDGDPSPPSGGIVQGLINSKITVSTVAVGTHGPAGSAELKKLANATGGKYYSVTNNAMLPKIFQKEARTVSRPLVYEDPAGFTPQIVFPHEMTSGIDRALPPLTGYVLTTVKANPLVEVIAVSPVGGERQNNSLVATWTYGLGKTVCFTSDAGARWAKAWTTWDAYGKFFSQLTRASMRPAGDQGKFTVTTDVANGEAQIVVTALDKDDEFLNFLDLGATVLGPDLKPRQVTFEQTAPGRYVGRFAAKESGSYFYMISPGPGLAPIRSGLNVSYSAEFRDRATNEPLLKLLANLRSRGGSAGRLIVDPDGRGRLEGLLATDVFRRDLHLATSSQDVWHLLLFGGACLFLADVFVRRVSLDVSWIARGATRVYNRLRGRGEAAPATEYMDRLRSRKAEIGDQLEQQRAATRFEPAGPPPAGDALAEELPDSPLPPVEQQPRSGGISAGEPEAESYTERLLKAKKQVWKNQPPGSEGNN
ncbi:MAG: VWA domain-containing protein [Pirellulales bacterium]|nr:VWA domain-containing protein [Pirellulales bacterium]